MIDLHCHLLPGVDDGSSDLSESIAMSRQLCSMGFTEICCTPHRPWPAIHRTDDELATVRKKLQDSLNKEGVSLRVHQGAEHWVTEVMERLAVGSIITYPNDKTFLMEFGLDGFPPNLDEFLFRVQLKGLRPVLAHVERYSEVRKDVSILGKFKERGCYILVNLASLVGGWDRRALKTARNVVRQGFADAATTDMHSVDDASLIRSGLQELEGLVGDDGVDTLMRKNPSKIAGLHDGSDLN